MNARKTLVASLVLVAAATSAIQAAPVVGTNKARGDFGGGGWQSQSRRVVPARPVYRYQAPTYAVAATSAPQAPAVAQAPQDARRFSYAPSVAPTTSAPCPPVTAQASAASDGARRYSYQPVPETAAAPPAPPSTTTYYAAPTYSGGNRSRAAVQHWALPKTDPRKFNSR